MTGEDRYRAAAETALTTVAPLMGRHARFAGWAAAVGEALLAGPAEVVVLDRPDLLRVARLGTSPGAVVVTGGPLGRGPTGGGRVRLPAVRLRGADHRRRPPGRAARRAYDLSPP